MRPLLGEYHRTFKNLMDHPDEKIFFNYMRMSYASYRELKDLILPHIRPIGSNWREPISGEEKLVLTIRHLATGSSFASMSAPFHMAKNTIAKHVYETCQKLWAVLQPIEMPKPSEDYWKRIAKRFGELWDFPFAVGALDGKHIAIVNPSNTGSMFYNYKGFPSIVLMALSDADSCFILVDCGQYGRVCDAGVFQNSVISELLERQQLNIPKGYFKVNTSNEKIPFMIVGDEAFPLKTYLMRPFAARTLNDERRIYNYRHSRARRSVECCFGILAKKFEVFQRPMRLQPDKVVAVTNAATVLHNYVRRRDGHMKDRTSSIKYELFQNTGNGLINLQPLHAKLAKHL
ncbi:uncharacterized protein LOC135497078 [Lineus longissimus]|uniref:uncharacterized protein LOC135497078 n=1 Tax=Lineus longissimus TaxID=88925 RepID=UPI00315C95C2